MPPLSARRQGYPDTGRAALAHRLSSCARQRSTRPYRRLAEGDLLTCGYSAMPLRVNETAGVISAGNKLFDEALSHAVKLSRHPDANPASRRTVRI